MSARKIAGIALTAAMTSGLGGCYVVPIQTQAEPGRAPVYAYVPVSEASRLPAGSPVSLSTGATYQVRLYPMNDAAARQGPLQGVVADNLAGHGSITMNVNGEQLQGEATRVPDNAPGFGKVIADVTGAVPAPGAGGRRGLANLTGSRGMYAACEYVLSARSIGTGACVFSTGAKYQLHFGS